MFERLDRWVRGCAVAAAIAGGIVASGSPSAAQGARRPGGAARASARPDTGAALGCWELRIGAWKSTGKTGGNSLSLPARIQLTRTPDTSMVAAGRALLMRAAPGAQPGSLRFSFWVPIAGDSVRLEWTGGFGGLVGRAHLRGDTLRGSLTTYTDVYPQHPDSAPLLAIRVPCKPAGSVRARSR